MAIRFTPEYNKYIRKTVNEYNRKVQRANTEGKVKKVDLPEMASVKTLKKSYLHRSDLDKELANLKAFSRKSARQQVVGNVTRYQLDMIKANREKTIEFFEHKADVIRKKATSGYPLQKDRLVAIEENLGILKKGVEGATEDELKAMSAYVNKYRGSFERQATGYRGFLSQVDLVMDDIKIPKEKQDELFNKLSKLDEEEFMDLYEKNDLIDDIFNLADSPKLTGGEFVLKDEQRAKDLIDTLLRDIDLMIAEVKSK